MIAAENETEGLNVVYSSDNKYAQHVGISMLSLFENNREFERITVYLIDNHISMANKSKLEEVCAKYRRSLVFIEFDETEYKRKLNANIDFSLSAYARLFLPSMLDEKVKKIIYMDCDSIVGGSLYELWHTDIRDYNVAGVSDTVSIATKTKVGLDGNSPYINSGMLVINLEKWRQEDIEGRFLTFIGDHGGHVFHHDQGVINGVLNGSMRILHPKFNAMTVFFTMKYDQLLQYYGLQEYYSRDMLEEAIREPAFIHYTPAFVNRPWIKGCRHPLMMVYRHYCDLSPWSGAGLERDNRKAIEKGMAFLYNHLPFRIANGIRKTVFHS